MKCWSKVLAEDSNLCIETQTWPVHLQFSHVQYWQCD